VIDLDCCGHQRCNDIRKEAKQAMLSTRCCMMLMLAKLSGRKGSGADRDLGRNVLAARCIRLALHVSLATDSVTTLS
jgi:hypothetical protein